MVVTTLQKEAAPLVRYRTRDLTRAIPGTCACGSILPRHDRFLGRSDDMFIFRAVNVYPGQIDHVLSAIPGIGSEYQVHLTRGKDGKDYMVIKAERGKECAPGDDARCKKLIESRGKKADHGKLRSRYLLLRRAAALREEDEKGVRQERRVKR